MVWGCIFEEDVTVTGDNWRIIFTNCEFKKNIYNRCGEGGKVVWMMPAFSPTAASAF